MDPEARFRAHPLNRPARLLPFATGLTAVLLTRHSPWWTFWLVALPLGAVISVGAMVVLDRRKERRARG